ncbi:MAG: hypothetical protein E7464_02250 [Ruminococcaceae bacterium]|nr:hypothetical protein [Oscillospiraceae bacterium]
MKMKYLRLLMVFLTMLVCFVLFSGQASAFDLRDVQPPASADKVVYGHSGAGRELVAYRFGSGKNVMVAGFAIHGYEDNFNKDGGALVYTANELMKRLDENRELITDYGWTVYVLPCMNPDGLMDGYTSNGPGRCTTTYLDANGQLVQGKGVDLNRSFPHNWTKYSTDRNFNGSKPLAALEAVALADFIRSVKGTGANVCIDAHGWFQQIKTSDGKNGHLNQVFSSRFPRNAYSSCTNSLGFFTSYAASIGYASCLFEFPYDIYSMSAFLRSGYCESFNLCILDLLKAYGSYNGHSHSCPSANFTDVIPWRWYHEAVDYAIGQGIFQGVAANRFAPEQGMTRAMFVTTLYRMANPNVEPFLETMKEPKRGEADSTLPIAPEGLEFIDVPSGAWYEVAVCWAVENGIVTGYPDGRFAPDDLLTREQLAVILHRYACYAGRSTETNASVSSFTDASAVSDYAKDALCWAYGIGLIQGAADGKGLSLQPKGTATRAQTAAILMRYRLSENKADTLKEFDIA